MQCNKYKLEKQDLKSEISGLLLCDTHRQLRSTVFVLFINKSENIFKTEIINHI